MDHDSYPDAYIRGILNTVKSIAMVGLSPKESRPSYFAFKYLLERGYNMIPVNPGQAGKEILGRKVYARLSDIREPVDMVDVFRASQFALPIVEEASKLHPRPQVIWMQLGVRNDEAAAKAEAAGIKVVMNRCPKIEYGRLSSEIGWMGVNSRTLTSTPARNRIPRPAPAPPPSIRPRRSCSMTSITLLRCSACRRSATSIPGSAIRPTQCWKSEWRRSKAAPPGLR